MSIYNPVPNKRGYFYHVEIYEEVLLTYEQYLVREHGDVCTSDPDDNTDYEAMKWYKVGSLSFAEKEWDKLVSGIRRHLVTRGPLLEETDELDKRYFYYFANDYKLKEKVLHRAWIYTYHHAFIEFDRDKFAKHMLLANR